MQNVILFIFTYIVVFLLYQLLFILPAKRLKKKKNSLIEIKYLEKKYNLDLTKINYNQLLQIICITSSLDISLIVSILLLFSNFLVSIIVSFFLIIIIFIISYHLVYLFYKKKIASK